MLQSFALKQRQQQLHDLILVLTHFSSSNEALAIGNTFVPPPTIANVIGTSIVPINR